MRTRRSAPHIGLPLSRCGAAGGEGGRTQGARVPGSLVFRVQSLFELTNSKPTKLALKAVPSEQPLGVRASGQRTAASVGPAYRCSCPRGGTPAATLPIWRRPARGQCVRVHMHIRMHMHMHMQMHMHMHMLHMHNSCACACCMCMCMCTCACACACAHVHVHVSYLVTGPGCRWHGLGAQPLWQLVQGDLRSLHELLVACFCGSAEGDTRSARKTCGLCNRLLVYLLP